MLDFSIKPQQLLDSEINWNGFSKKWEYFLKYDDSDIQLFKIFIHRGQGLSKKSKWGNNSQT